METWKNHGILLVNRSGNPEVCAHSLRRILELKMHQSVSSILKKNVKNPPILWWMKTTSAHRNIANHTVQQKCRTHRAPVLCKQIIFQDLEFATPPPPKPIARFTRELTGESENTLGAFLPEHVSVIHVLTSETGAGRGSLKLIRSSGVIILVFSALISTHGSARAFRHTTPSLRVTQTAIAEG